MICWFCFWFGIIFYVFGLLCNGEKRGKEKDEIELDRQRFGLSASTYYYANKRLKISLQDHPITHKFKSATHTDARL